MRLNVDLSDLEMPTMAVEVEPGMRIDDVLALITV